MPRERWSLIVGSLGLALLLAGLLVFFEQVFEAIDTGRWPERTLWTLLHAPGVQRVLPLAFRTWLERPAPDDAVQTSVRWLVEAVPLALLLGGVGVVMIWKTSRLDRSRVGE